MELTTLENQSLMDISIWAYGTTNGISKIMELNPNLQFNPTNDISGKVIAGQIIIVDRTWNGTDNFALKQMGNFVPQTFVD